MKIITIIISIVISSIFIVGANVGISAENATEKFKVDTALKIRMESILNTMKSFHEKEKTLKEKESVAEGKNAGKSLESTVQDIFKNCKLEPKADSAIHPILADILNGASMLKSGKKKEGHDLVHKALLRYENHFDHPGWVHGND